MWFESGVFSWRHHSFKQVVALPELSPEEDHWKALLVAMGKPVAGWKKVKRPKGHPIEQPEPDDVILW